MHISLTSKLFSWKWMATIIPVLVFENLVNANFLTPHSSKTSYPHKMLKSRRTITHFLKMSLSCMHTMVWASAMRVAYSFEIFIREKSRTMWKMFQLWFHIPLKKDSFEYTIGSFVFYFSKTAALSCWDNRSVKSSLWKRLNEKTLHSFIVYLFWLTQMLKWW